MDFGVKPINYRPPLLVILTKNDYTVKKITVKKITVEKITRKKITGIKICNEITGIKSVIKLLL
jgi:hypothetical protein